MRIFVVGAGAIGTYLGVTLSEHAELSVVVRNETEAAELTKFELLGQAPKSAALRVVTVAALACRAEDVVISTVKSTDLESSLSELGPKLNNALLVLAQNGLGIAFHVAKLLPSATLARAACWMGIRNEGRGRARVAGVHSLAIAPCIVRAEAAVAELCTICERAGIPTERSTDATLLEWKKALWNLAVNPLCATLGGKNGIVLEHEGLRAAAERLLDEAMRVAEADGVRLSERDRAKVFESLAITRNNENASLQDLKRGRKTELDWLTGHVVRRGRALGIGVPCSELVLAQVAYLELNQSRLRSAES